jgi:hypothetical protein
MAAMYRVESKARREGAYRTDASFTAGVGNEPPETHPGPHEDPGLKLWWKNHRLDSVDYLFGFTSKEQYIAWFFDCGGREDIADEHVLAVYEVPDEFTQHSKFQMIGHSDHMSHQHDLNTFTLEVIPNENC